MATPWPCPFPTYHDNTYPAISPTNPSAISAISGKRIIITGAGSGIGRETVFAFAAAGADHISILGRTESTLNKTKEIAEEKFSKTSVSVYVCDVSKEEDVKRASDAMGQWDVLVLNAGYIESPRRIEEVDVGDWWKTYEINVLGPLLLVKTLLPTRNRSSTTPAKIISTSAGIAHIPPTFCKTLSGYTSSKLAALRFFEVLAAEHTPEDLYVVSFQPGVVDTTMLNKSGFTAPALDDVRLPAHFAVWLSTPAAHFLRAKMVWCNWDVDEMMAAEKDIVGVGVNQGKGKAGEEEEGGGGTGVFETGLRGWPVLR